MFEETKTRLGEKELAVKIHGRRYVRSDETFVAQCERGEVRETGCRENFACDNYKYEREKDVRVRHGFGNLKIMRPDPRPVPFVEVHRQKRRLRILHRAR